MSDVYAATAERYVRALASQLVAPDGHECLSCYVQRMVTLHGCDNTLRWVEKWQRATPRSTRRLRTQLRSRGAYCDCEAILNVLGVDIPRSPDLLRRCDHAAGD